MKWIEPAPVNINPEIESTFGGTFLLPRLLARQQIFSLPKARIFLGLDPYPASSPFDFPQMEKAVSRLCKARQKGEKIGIWGDFDVDGQTSTALLTEGLRKFGLNVVFRVPIRSQESHGIKAESLERFIHQEKPDLFITCDTGISEFSAFEYLYDHGIDAIITDHHTPSEKNPHALACINPHFLPAGHPMQFLAGVGTAYQLIQSLTDHVKFDTGSLLDLVALGTIADVAELTEENRYLVREGLQKFNTSPRKSLAQLINYLDLKTKIINESHISFGIAPRLNASGRMDDANPIVDFLLTDDEQEINKTILYLESLNSRRKLVVKLIYEAALEMISKNDFLNRYPVLILAKENWPGGILGIVASRLAEKYNKPVILLTIEGEIARGSARSIQGVNIYEAIHNFGNFLISGGGHAMAAGLSIKADRIHEFREQLSVFLIRSYPRIHADSELVIDAYIDIGTLKSINKSELGLLSPFGAGNPAPILAVKNVDITEQSVIGRKKEHRKITFSDKSGQSADALWWNSSEEQLPVGPFDLAFSFRPGGNNASEEMTLEWKDFRDSSQEESITIEGPNKYEYFDFRKSPDQERIFSDLKEKEKLIAWAEGISSENNLASRSQLQPAASLAILTPPASREVLSQIVSSVFPSRIYLFNLFPFNDSLKAVSSMILGLIKYQINHNNGIINTIMLSEASGQDEKTIMQALDWFTALGKIRLTKNESNIYASFEKLEPNIHENRLKSAFKQALDETSAYRAFFLRALPQQIFTGL